MTYQVAFVLACAIIAGTNALLFPGKLQQLRGLRVAESNPPAPVPPLGTWNFMKGCNYKLTDKADPDHFKMTFPRNKSLSSTDFTDGMQAAYASGADLFYSESENLNSNASGHSKIGSVGTFVIINLGEDSDLIPKSDPNIDCTHASDVGTNGGLWLRKDDKWDRYTWMNDQGRLHMNGAIRTLIDASHAYLSIAVPQIELKKFMEESSKASKITALDRLIGGLAVGLLSAFIGLASGGLAAPEILLADDDLTAAFIGSFVGTPQKGFAGWKSLIPFIDNEISPVESWCVGAMKNAIDVQKEMNQTFQVVHTYVQMVVESDKALQQRADAMTNQELVYWLLYCNRTSTYDYQYKQLDEGTKQLDHINQLGQNWTDPSKGDGCHTVIMKPRPQRWCSKMHYVKGLCKRNYGDCKPEDLPDRKNCGIWYDYGQCKWDHEDPGTDTTGWTHTRWVRYDWGNVSVPQAKKLNVLWTPESGKDSDDTDCNCQDLSKYPK